ncbi:MAG: hypothetical protein PHV37_07410 [Candidatus Gastranaerophilales bacterium]|nr:hypothetical protein [Candidatus Gastranaerophilales bacterium]
MNNVFERGSEWRRWDLHLHTPGTLKNDQFDGSSLDEKWEKFYQDIDSYIGDSANSLKNIAVVGITDYLSIDNYKKIVAENRLPDSIKLILPNIEMRLQPISGDSPINIHFIFNPKIIDQLESRFFSKLKFPYDNTNFNASKVDLTRLGKTFDNTLDEQNAYKKGIEMFVVSFDSIKNIFDEDMDLRENVVIGVSNSSCDGASGIVNHSDYMIGKSSQLIAVRQAIYKFVDIIFSATPSDINYFLGKKETCSIEKVIKECGSLKPCLHGSDAHTNTKIFEPDEQRYCWVKSDPTFNGLKQIKYEPEERVRICSSKPETKSDYFVIDRVEYNDSNFQTEPIYFNDKLTCIIGGKSTGKSILIQNLAMAIDKNEAEKCLEKSKNKTLQVNNIKVFWADKTEENRKIIYIPQTYLNKLTDEQQEKTEIDSWIQNIILNKPEIGAAHETFLLRIKEYKGNLEKNILDLFSKHEEYINLKEQIDNLGTKTGIEKEIKKLEAEKNLQSKDVEFYSEDATLYEESLSKLDSKKQEKENLLYTKNKISNIENLIEVKQLDFNISNEFINTIIEKQKEIVDNAKALWTEQKKSTLTIIEKSLECIEKEINDHESLIKKLEEKIKTNNAVLECARKIQLEKTKLSEYLKKEEILALNKKGMDDFLSKLIESIDFYKLEHQTFASLVNKDKIVDDGLEFYVENPFRKDTFTEKLLAIFKNNNAKFKSLIDIENFDETSYTKDKIKSLIKEIIENPSVLKADYTPESALREILSDWYNTVYRVKMDNDSIDKMSPGKKALVLLKILISLAETQCPILIDQPEDDLDNRSIYDDLVNYIKKKKKERQIIIVTHNANLVLGCDADEIIIANQDGITSPNKKYKFEYRSGSIENHLPLYDAKGNIESGILNKQGIQQHICDILEGGEIAFEKRKNKYNI